MATGQQEKRPTLTAQMPEELVKNFRQSEAFFFRLVLWGMIVPQWFFVLAVLLGEPVDVASAFVVVTTTIGVSTVWAIFVIATGAYARNSWTESNRPAVEYHDGTLTLRRRRRAEIVIKVHYCHFWIGPARHMTFGLPRYMIATSFLKNRFAPVAHRDVILIEIPPLYQWFGRARGYRTAAVGYTEESFAQWVDLLGDAIEGPPGRSEDARHTSSRQAIS